MKLGRFIRLKFRLMGGLMLGRLWQSKPFVAGVFAGEE
jgi:hypothetical protein